jgi:predicted Rossmann fold nucleotide-binding protein DprA/Smf involved in DNA uptake
VETADDIVGELGYGRQVVATGHDLLSCSGSSTSADPVLRVMERGQAYDLDELACGSGLDLARLLPRLMDLELRGLVRRAGGGRFLRTS